MRIIMKGGWICCFKVRAARLKAVKIISSYTAAFLSQND